MVGGVVLLHTYVYTRISSFFICWVSHDNMSFSCRLFAPDVAVLAAQVSLPEIDGAIEPIIYAGREGATGRSVPLADRVQLVADRALKVRL